jgi:hypothetical protein
MTGVRWFRSNAVGTPGVIARVPNPRRPNVSPITSPATDIFLQHADGGLLSLAFRAHQE